MSWSKEKFVRCYSKAECDQWLASRSRQLPDEIDGLSFFTEKMQDQRAYPFAHWFAKYSTFESGVFLWITEWGIWPSSENHHLFYKLRHIYGEDRLLHEAPGHYFLSYEMDDLASMLQICILNGWGGYILTEANYVNAFFSHDEYINFYANGESELDQVKKWFGP